MPQENRGLAGSIFTYFLLHTQEARVEVREVEGAPGSYRAIAYLRPWLQMEELTASLRLVASIPDSRQE